ncbi:MAG TPA: ribonuclease catalytic domain-containing protein, partial [Pyrinomonadaceae bacterium]|nr:ribonuclease catalytic domain-containing protein [Pyrinomonadaceae bacterium]
MTKHTARSNSIDLRAIAEQTMIEAGFATEFDSSVKDQLQAILAKNPAGPSASGMRDMRDLLWSSIDDSKSRDLDQVEYAEALAGGDTRLYVGIADVDEDVSKGSPIDEHAAQNGTSVYTGVKTFPMLPEELSTGLTSLNAAQDRLAIVTEMVLAHDGNVKSTNIYRALLKNHAKLSYEDVGNWLDGKTETPASVRDVAGLEEQIRLQFESAKDLSELRKQHGALELGTIQATPSVDESGKVVELSVVEQNGARDLIANFMIAANVAMAKFLEAKGGPTLQRVVRTPKYWSRIVEIAAEDGEQLPAQPDSRALAEFLARRKVADPLHFPDLS